MIKKFRGFTLIELLVVIVIIGILASLTAIGLNNVRAKARDSRRISDIKQMQTALELYFADNSIYPAAGVSAGMFAVGKPLISSSSPSMTYIKSVPTNPTPRAENGCADEDYVYYSSIAGDKYFLSGCLAVGAAELSPGVFFARNGAAAAGCGSSQVVDASGIVYNTVLINGKCWFKENLANTAGLVKNTDYRYVPILSGANAEETNLSYMVDGSTSVLGYLYNWAAMMGLPAACNANFSGLTGCSVWTEPRQGLCPSGWHIPTDTELATLLNYAETLAGGANPAICATAGNCTNAGKVLKESGTNYWSSVGGSPNNLTGFTVRGAGGFFNGTTYRDRGAMAYLGSSTEKVLNTFWYRYFRNVDALTARSDATKTDFVSVRCIKN